MPELTIPDLRSGYLDLVRWVQTEGDRVSPRGIPTIEVQGALITLEDPYDALPLGIGRGVSTGIAAVEALQLLAGVTRPELVVDIGPIFENFRENNGEFHGAYGPRTAGQIEIMIKRLKADPDTRQAVTTIWDKRFDLMESKRDYPCTLTFTFHIRSGRLNMRTHMRSNDVIKGVGYDYFQFTRVQIAMASVLNIPVGRYFHYADSLHLYESDLALIEKLHLPVPDTAQRTKTCPYIAGVTWDDVRRQAQACLNAAENPLENQRGFDRAQRWYTKAMIDAMRRNSEKLIGSANG